jgi:hypothetical protein
MKRSPVIVATVLTLLIASMAGVAYAHWTKIITVDGTVTSGTLDWIFYQIKSTDSGTDPDDHCGHGFTPPFIENSKHVGTTTVWLDQDPHFAHVLLENVYPCYYVTVNFYPMSIGTIPIKIDTLKVYDEAGGLIATIRTSGNKYFSIDRDGDGLCEIEFLYLDNFGTQLHEGEFVEISFWIHICEDAEQLSTYGFKFELSCINWNEYVAP